MIKNDKKRCFGNKIGQETYALYHDTEWGIPVYDDTKLFEMLILEGAQAGLTWETILKRRDGYRKAFYDFYPQKVAVMKDSELELLRDNQNIIRNRLKIYSTRQNAIIFLEIQKEFVSFSAYIWSYVGGNPIMNSWSKFADVPTSTKESDDISKDLKKRGMKFVGSVIMYAYMQAVGMVNDHLTDCWCYKKDN